MEREDLLEAVRALVDLDRRDRAQQAAEQLPDDLAVADLLRAADGAQQLARAVAARRRHAGGDAEHPAGHDPHDVRSLYS